MDDSETILKELQKLNDRIADIRWGINVLIVIGIAISVVGGGLVLHFFW